MTIQDALARAMHLPDDSDTVRSLHEGGFAIADEDTMSRAIHDLYCGIMADHHEPNAKDLDQARSMIAALQKHATAPSPG